jgi:alpha-L-rhamnosidase
MAIRPWGVAAVAAAVCVAVSPARADDAFTLSSAPIPASDAWRSHVLADDATTLKPVHATATGNVTDPQALVTGTGTTTLTNVAGQAPPIVVLDYGKEVGGLPFFGVSSVTGTSVTMRAGYSEAAQYLLGAAPTTTLTSAAAAGDTNVKVASTTNFFAGSPATIAGEPVTVTDVGSAAAADTALAAPAAAGDTNVFVDSVNGYAAGAPITIDGESKTISAVGTAAGAPTTLAAPAAAGDTNVKVPSVAGFAAGQKLVLEGETRTVSSVGSAASITSLASTATAGDTNVKLASVAGLAPGDTLNVESEPVTIASVGTAATNTSLAAGTTTAVGLPVPSYTGAHWVWNTPGAASGAAVGTIFVRRDFNLTADQVANLSTAALRINVDDGYSAWVNGTLVASSNVGNGWRTSQLVSVKPYLTAGKNVIAIAPNNTSAGAGSMIAALRLDFASGDPLVIQSDSSWLTTPQTCTDSIPDCIASTPWTAVDFDDSSWVPVADSGAYPIAPWNTLNEPNSPSANNIKVASVSGFAAGDVVLLEPGPNQESATIQSVGTAGATGSGLTLTSNLTKVHATGLSVIDLSKPGTGVTFSPALGAGHAVGSTVTDPGTGVTFSPGLAQAHAAGAAIQGLGSGITVSSPLSAAHPAGAAVSSPGTGISFTPALTAAHDAGGAVVGTPVTVVGDRNGNNGVGTDGSRADNFTLTPASGGTTVGNAVTAVQGGQRFQAITLTTPGTVSLSNVGITAKFNNFGASSYDGSFLSSDEALNKIWYQGVYTNQTDGIPAGGVCSNATTCSQAPTILDGAKRDRRPWSGDLSVQNRSMADSLGFGADGTDYIRDTIGGFGSRPAANGSICGQTSNWVNYPTAPVTCSFYSTSYSMYYVLDLAGYYLYSGDVPFAESQYQVMKNQLAYDRTLVDAGTGLLVTASGERDWDFYDGGKPGAVTAYNAIYYKALVDAAMIASDLAERDPGNADAATWTADAATWNSQAADLKQRVNATLYDSARGVYKLADRDNTTHAGASVAQDANAEAINYGLAPASAHAGILNYLKSNLWGTFGPQPYSRDANYSTVISPFVTGMELDARFLAGDTANAYQLMHTMWDQMTVESGPYYTGTLWEKLNQDGTDVDSNASLSHGWATGPVSSLSGYVLGARPVTPGYRTWIIAPQPGSLEWAQGQVPTPAGSLVSRWRHATDNSAFQLTMSAPGGTSGSVVVPLFGHSRTIAMDGHAVWQDGAPVGNVTAVAKDGAVEFSGVTGAHTFAWGTSTATAGSPVGGSVPATLSLSLGPAASFGAFTPGVAKDYAAQTTANVISTAGDAALSFSDPGHLTNGAFALPEPLQVTLSKASWTGPVSNDVVTIGFAQHVGATDALRTGAYSKTLTFTLSTTTP